MCEFVEFTQICLFKGPGEGFLNSLRTFGVGYPIVYDPTTVQSGLCSLAVPLSRSSSIVPSKFILLQLSNLAFVLEKQASEHPNPRPLLFEPLLYQHDGPQINETRKRREARKKREADRAPEFADAEFFHTAETGGQREGDLHNQQRPVRLNCEFFLPLSTFFSRI